MSRRALQAQDSPCRVAGATYLATPGARLVIPCGPIRRPSRCRRFARHWPRHSDFPNPKHAEIPHLLFERTIQCAGQSFAEPPSAYTGGEVFVNQHCFENRFHLTCRIFPDEPRSSQVNVNRPTFGSTMRPTPRCYFRSRTAGTAKTPNEGCPDRPHGSVLASLFDHRSSVSFPKAPFACGL